MYYVNRKDNNWMVDRSRELKKVSAWRGEPSN